MFGGFDVEEGGEGQPVSDFLIPENCRKGSNSSVHQDPQRGVQLSCPALGLQIAVLGLAGDFALGTSGLGHTLPK